MAITATLRSADELVSLHELYRAEANCQILRDSFWFRGLFDVYVIQVDGRLAGHGAISNHYDKGQAVEFYTFPEFRRQALAMFRELIAAANATHVAAQTNIPLMLLMLNECATDIRPEKVLFADASPTHLICPWNAVFRRKRASPDELPIFAHHREPEGEWVIEADGKIIATGGFLTHYNPPYADLYMEVKESHRRAGVGSFLIQELRKQCYEHGKRPAARCDVDNVASRRTLERGGLLAYGHLLIGRIR